MSNTILRIPLFDGKLFTQDKPDNCAYYALANLFNDERFVIYEEMWRDQIGHGVSGTPFGNIPGFINEIHPELSLNPLIVLPYVDNQFAPFEFLQDPRTRGEWMFDIINVFEPELDSGQCFPLLITMNTNSGQSHIIAAHLHNGLLMVLDSCKTMQQAFAKPVEFFRKKKVTGFHYLINKDGFPVYFKHAPQ